MPAEKAEPQYLYNCPSCGGQRYVSDHDTVPMCCGAFMRWVAMEGMDQK